MTASGRSAGLALTVLALLVVTGCVLPFLDGPWDHVWLGHNGARYSQIARNYARLGLTHAGGAPLRDAAAPAGEAVDQDGSVRSPDVYAHHPPGVPMVLGVLFGAFGESERLARLFALASTLAALALLAWLVGSVCGPRLGGLAALLAAAMPMTIVYATHVEVQGPQVLAAGLAVLVAYQHGLRGGSWIPWVGMAVLAAFFDWYGLYAVAGCALHAGLVVPGRRRTALGLAGVGAALFGLWVLWLGTRPGMTPATVFAAAGVRGAGGLSVEGLPVARLLPAAWADSLTLLPLWPLLLGLVVLILAGRVGSPPAPEDGSRGLGVRGLLALLCVPPILHGALFPAGLLVHNYWWFGLPLGLGTALAVGLAALAPRLAVVLVALLLGLDGWLLTRAIPPSNVIPALVGQALAAETEPGDLILTNYDCNTLLPGATGDAYVAKLPEVTYYADRPIRGGVGARPALPGLAAGVALDEALQRLPAARWFLLTPDAAAWLEPPPEELAAAVMARAVGEPRVLSDRPPVLLLRLRGP